MKRLSRCIEQLNTEEQPCRSMFRISHRKGSCGSWQLVSGRQTSAVRFTNWLGPVNCAVAVQSQRILTLGSAYLSPRRDLSTGGFNREMKLSAFRSLKNLIFPFLAMVGIIFTIFACFDISVYCAVNANFLYLYKF